MLYLIGIVVSYAAFVSITQSANPFQRVDGHSKKKRFAFGRSTALILLFSALAIHSIGNLNGLSLVRQLVAYVVLSGFLIIPAAVDYFRLRISRV